MNVPLHNPNTTAGMAADNVVCPLDAVRNKFGFLPRSLRHEVVEMEAMVIF